MKRNLRDVRALLEPAIEAARGVLRRMEDEEVPARLHRVAAYGGGRLPPPLAKTLIEVIDGDPAFLEKVAEAWESGDDGADNAPVVASRSFLTRPAGWWLDIMTLQAARSTSETAQRLRRLESAEAELTRKLAEAQRRLRAERDAAEQHSKHVAADEADRRARLEAAAEGARRDVDALQAAIRNLEARLDAARGDVEESERYLASLRDQARSARRDRAYMERRMVAASRESIPALTDPLDLARHLDGVSAAVRPSVAAVQPRERSPRPGLTLPGGMRPDAPEALDWVLSREQPTTMLVDGYNVSFLIDEGAFSTPESRRKLNSELSRLAGHARGRLSVVVVYDSSLPGERGFDTAGKDVHVVFAPEDMLADDEIVARAMAAESPVIVVSNDREVREDAERSGALALWSTGIVAWFRRRT